MGRDVMGSAQTGTGKTASFTLPMLDILESGIAKARMPRTLILAPTRELAAQVAESFEKFSVNHELSMALLIGGVSFSDQESALERGVDVLIATPGRLLDHFERGKVLLQDVKILVIDETDRMLDMGFIPQVRRIVRLTPHPDNRQTMFFSATFTLEVMELARQWTVDPTTVEIEPNNIATQNVTQKVYITPTNEKFEWQYY
jgi:superfamily II DNA/RNA helicase